MSLKELRLTCEVIWGGYGSAKCSDKNLGLEIRASGRDPKSSDAKNFALAVDLGAINVPSGFS